MFSRIRSKALVKLINWMVFAKELLFKNTGVL